VPVLITDKINIWREIAQDKAGLIETDTVNGVVTLLKQWLSMDDSMQEKMRNNALKCFSNHFEARNASQSFIASIQKFI